MLWGWSFSFWEWIVKASLVIAVLTSIATAFFAFVAGYVGYELADAVGKISDQKVADALATAGNANERAALAEKTTEAERLERLKLQVAVAPRNLSLEQQAKIAESLILFSGKRVSLNTYALDADAASLALQIMSCLDRSGLVPQNDIASIMPLGGFAAGIHISGNDKALVEQIAYSLATIGNLAVAPPNSEQNQQAGLANAPGTHSVPGPDATILIGVKPIQLIGK